MYIYKFLVLLFLSFSVTSYGADKNNDAATWPKSVKFNSHSITIYQPQAEEYEHNRLEFSMAIGMKADGADQAQYGSVTGECDIQTNKQDRQATCSNIEIDSIDFPNAEQGEKLLIVIANEQLAGKSFSMSLDQMLASLKLAKITHLHNDKVSLKTTPPKIYVAEQASVLVILDGKAQLRKMDDSTLMRVINTAFFIVLDTESNDYYLQAGSQWMTATDVMGPWQVAQSIPDSVKKLERKQDNGAKQQDSGQTPQIIVSTEPAALIQINGQPEFTPIEKTNLLYISNSSDNVFYQTVQQKYYVLLSGRWYQSDKLSTDAKWHYIPANKLSLAFTKIPKDSHHANALTSIPGTEQAQKAVIENQVPQTAKVKRSEASVKVNYDGKPKMKKISGTKLSYAENADIPIIYYKNNYYAVYQGLWFIASDANGPWEVLVDVPDIMYSIPASSAIYPVTYVYVYDYDPDYVYVGYTGGYLNSYIMDGLLMYGTGYYYPGWVGRVYYGAPVTYGFGFRYNSITGWSVGVYYGNPYWFGGGLRIGHLGPIGWRSGWFGAGRGAVFDNHVNISRHFNFNPTINIDNSHNIYNRWGKNTVVNDWNQNRTQRFTNSAKTQQFAEKHPDTRTKAQKAKARHSQAKDKAVQKQARLDEIAPKKHHEKQNNIYKGKDNQIYRHKHEQGWQRASHEGWQNHKVTEPRHRQVQQHLNQQRQVRNHGVESHQQMRARHAGHQAGGFSGRQVRPAAHQGGRHGRR